MRERGLKYKPNLQNIAMLPVAPYAGAWIEIEYMHKRFSLLYVAPYAGAWIEITVATYKNVLSGVAPYAGAWIEIYYIQTTRKKS